MNKSDDQQNLKEKVHQICRDYLQGPWKRISAEDLQLSAVKGGLSSGLGLYLCALPDSVPDVNEIKDKNIPRKVLIRFHNSSIHSDDEIVQETVIFATMSEKNLGPKVYGVFPGGRIEEYIPSRVTDWDDFTDLNLTVAKYIAKIHSLTMPIKKTAMFKERVFEYLEEYETLSKVKPVNVPEFVSSGELRKEVIWLMEEIKKLNPKLVFCHNDLQGGNVLLLNDSHQSSEKRIKIIDYEFCAYNYRTFDMVSYFGTKCFYFKPAETPLKFRADFDRYPTQAEQEKFVRTYVNEFYEINGEFRNDSEKDKEVNDILKEIEIMQFAPSIYWWSFLLKEIVNPRLEGLPFKDSLPEMVDMYKEFKKQRGY